MQITRRFSKFKKNKITIRAFAIIIFAFYLQTVIPCYVCANSDIDALVADVRSADAQMAEISQQRYEIDKKITAINAEIPGIEAKNQALSEQLEQGKNNMEERLRVMYMYNTDDIFQVLFSATSFADLVSRAELVLSVYQADREQLNELKKIQADIEKNQQQLEKDLATLNESMDALVQKESEIAAICAEKQQKLQDAQVAAAYEEAMRNASQSGTTSDGSGSDSSSSSSSSDSSQSQASSSGSTSGNSTQSINYSDFDMICAIVRHEGGASYEGSLAVISCVMNRVDVGWGGSDPLSVLTAPYQFESYFGGYYQQFLGADIPNTRQAVIDCIEGGKRSHSYLSFRSYQTSGSVNICGNWYFNSMY